MCGVRIFRAFFSIQFLIAAIVLMVIAGSIYFKQKDWVRAEAVISSIIVTKDHDGETQHTVIVSYQSEDGASYEEHLGYYDSSLRNGMKIPICYDPDDPSQVVIGRQSTPIKMAAVSLVLLAVSGGLWIFMGKKLKEYGLM